MIWPDTGSHLNSSFLQPHLPPGSSLNTDTLLPSCICTGGSSAWRELPPDILVHILSCPSHLYSDIISSTRPTLTTLVKQPHSLYPCTYILGHLHQRTCQSLGRHFPHLLGSLCSHSSEHRARGQQSVSVFSLLRFHRCKNRASPGTQQISDEGMISVHASVFHLH